MSEMFPEYPKRFTEKDISCLCHIDNPWALAHATPAEKLCKRCMDYLRYFEMQYQSLSTANKNGGG